MIEIMREQTLRSLAAQKNIFLTIVFALLIVVLILSVFLFTKTERILVIPGSLEKEFWVDGTNMSPTYLEQMGCFIGDLLLTRSPAYSDAQLEILMRNTLPEYIPVLTKKLVEELAKLKKDNASYVFFRTSVYVEPHSQTVLLEGDRLLYLGDKVLSKSHEKYQLGFSSFGGRLFFSSIERVEK